MTTAAALRDIGTLVRLVPLRQRLAAVAVLVGVSASEWIGVLLLLPMLELVGIGTTAAGGDGLARLVTAGLAVVGLRPTLESVLVLFVAVTAIRTAFERWQTVLGATLLQGIVLRLRERLYEAMTRTRWEFFVARRSSSFLHALTDSANRAGACAYYALELLVTAGVVVAYFSVAFYLAPALTAIVAAAGLAIAVTLRSRISRARRVGEDATASAQNMYHAIGDHLGNMKTVRAYGVEGRHVEAFAQLSRELARATARVSVEFGSFRQALALATAVGLAATVYVAVRVVVVPPATLLLLLFAFARLLPRLTGLYEKAQTLAAELPAVALVQRTIDECLAAAQPLPTAVGRIAFSEAVAFDAVSFTYAEAGAPAALLEVTLTIRAGTTTAIVGPSGAGKSTLSDLLLGLIRPTTGEIRVDGRPLDADVLESWRAQIGYVPQDTVLFHDSVRANVRWAKTDATDADIWEALETANAASFVRGFAEGLDTVVGDRGARLSGGERQRLALARALLRKPRMLLLDEATSSLDDESQARIQSAIDRLHHHVTIVTITHRLPSVRTADVIYVLDRGRLVQAGSWTALLAAPESRFAELLGASPLLKSGSP